MDNKSMAFCIIAIVVGAGLGFGLSYAVFQPSINNLQASNTQLQNALTAASNDLKSVSQTVNQVASQSWHKVYSHTVSTGAASNNLTSTAFQIKGRTANLRWYVTGSPTDWIEITVFYQNGTVLSNRGSSGIYGSFACDIPIFQPGQYYVGIQTAGSVALYTVAIWDYY